MFKFKRFYKTHKWQILQVLIVSAFISFNQLISFLVRKSNLFYVPNENPFGFQAGVGISSIIIIFLCWSLAYFKILTKYPVPSILIFSGAFSNYFEKWLFYGNVADYISIPISHFNISDLQIWVGLIMLNWEVWFGDKSVKKQNEGMMEIKA